MNRLALIGFVAALLGVVVASPVAAQDRITEKAAAQEHAKRVLIRKTRKAGTDFKRREIRANCVRSTDYWRCRVKASNESGACEGSMRLYNAAGPFFSRKVVIGCVPAPPPPPTN